MKSIRGASGGYVLNKKAEEISVGDVLRALEGSLEPVKCAAFIRKTAAFQRTVVYQICMEKNQ